MEITTACRQVIRTDRERRLCAVSDIALYHGCEFFGFWVAVFRNFSSPLAG